MEGLEGLRRSQKDMGGPEDVRGGECAGQGLRNPVLSYALLLLFQLAGNDCYFLRKDQ